MRSVTKTVLTAFLEGRALNLQNARTDGRSLWLDGLEIIRRDPGGFEFTLAGCNTVTTREWINGCLVLVGSPCRVYQDKFSPYLRIPAMRPRDFR